jgi:hypothetical protein
VHLLETRDLEHQAPGTVLQDVETLLGLVGDEGMPVTAGHVLAMRNLETINRSLTQPIELRLKRAMQKSYPPINGLYLLLRSTGLGLIDTEPKKPRLKLDASILESWRALNAAERYFALLKAWWGRASEEAIGEQGFGGGEILVKLTYFIESFPKTGTLTVETLQDAEGLRYYPGLHNLALMALFGLLEIRLKPPTESRGWQPERMRMTDWGNLLLNSYTAFIRQSRTSESKLGLPALGFTGRFEPLERFESWSRHVRPYIKGWHRDLAIPEPAFQPGPHLFKVSWGTKCWRLIAIRGDSCLDELAIAILDAFDFDSDHLYRFSYKDRFGRTFDIDHPYIARESDNSLADVVKVGDLPLYPGMGIDFLYDFGDQWLFKIRTERVNVESAIDKPQILETHGEAPEQYGGW